MASKWNWQASVRLAYVALVMYIRMYHRLGIIGAYAYILLQMVRIIRLLESMHLSTQVCGKTMAINN